MTDTLQAIAENTAASAVLVGDLAKLDKPVGKTMTRRWAELDKPTPLEETRTPEEIIDHIRRKLEEVS